MPEAILQLKQFLNAIHPVPPPVWEEFAGLWQPFSARRKEILTRVGEAEKYLYFVVAGVQRVYYLDEQNREATLVFTYAPSFGGVLDAMLLQQPARYYYETLTPSVFLRAFIREVLPFMHQQPDLAFLLNQGLTRTLSGVLERLVELQCYSSEEKFRKLLQRSPHILQLVPHKYLANYLGIEATNFSKLLNKVRI